MGSIPTRPRHFFCKEPQLSDAGTKAEEASREPVLLIANPAAGGGAGAKAAAKMTAALDAADIAFEMRLTEAPGEAAEIAARAAQEETRTILASGGDGTIHEVVQGMLDSGASEIPSLAVHPVGTGNDFYRMVSDDRSAAAAARAITGGRTRRFDVGCLRANGETAIFVNLIGVGIDVEVLRSRARFGFLTGLPQYLAAFVAALFRYRPLRLRAALNDGEEEMDARTLIFVITVGPSLGGGFRINPDAKPDDGALDLFHAPPLKPRRLLRIVPLAIRGGHRKMEELVFRQVSSVVIRPRGKDPLWYQMDGELAPEPTDKLDIRVLRGTLPVLIPGAAP